jgi:hypothetical protein
MIRGISGSRMIYLSAKVRVVPSGPDHPDCLGVPRQSPCADVVVTATLSWATLGCTLRAQAEDRSFQKVATILSLQCFVVRKHKVSLLFVIVLLIEALF